MFTEEAYRRFITKLHSIYTIDGVLASSGRFLRTAFGFKTFEATVFNDEGITRIRQGYSARERALLDRHEKTIHRSIEKIKRNRYDLGTEYLLVANAKHDPRASDKQLVAALKEKSYLLAPLLVPRRSHDLLKKNRCVSEDLGIPSADGKHYIHGYLHVARRSGQSSISPPEAEAIMGVAHEIARALLLARFVDLINLLASTDALTGLRDFDRVFLPSLNKEFHNGPTVSLIVIDVDHFKPYNDTFGHPFGSRLIGQFARFFSERLKKRDLLSRMGGDEFIILLKENKTGAGKIAERLCRQFEPHPFERNGEGGLARLTVSMGVADSRNIKTPQELLEKADSALFQAKRGGRNRVHIG